MTRVKIQAVEDVTEAANNGDVFVRNKAHADGGTWQAPASGGQLPVGSVYENVLDGTNPATLLGYGTWVALGAGRVLVGIDAGDADFDAAGETGGAKTASHTHGPGTLSTDTFAGHTHGAGTLLPSAHSGTAVDAHSGTAVAAHASHTHSSWGLTVADHAAHTHGYGTIAVADHAAHTHGYGTIAVADHPNHKHELLKADLPAHVHSVLASKTAHTHGQRIKNTGTAGAAGAQGASTANDTTAGTTVSGGPATFDTESTGNAGTCYTQKQVDDSSGGALTLSHSLSGSTGNPSATLSHSLSGSTGNPSATLSHVVSGDTGAESATLTHSVTQPASHVVTQPSAHTMSGATASDGAHLHTVNGGATASGGGSIVQPYIVVYRWYRFA